MGVARHHRKMGAISAVARGFARRKRWQSCRGTPEGRRRSSCGKSQAAGKSHNRRREEAAGMDQLLAEPALVLRIRSFNGAGPFSCRAEALEAAGLGPEWIWV